ncbi:1,8-cineole synthase [Parasponia andersonii]|uniref:1,8-cineole synthase n=1 Tax=Parasponia andersonii TaxID=3476 RepID=A0A2P5C4I3_PARAD|nr:1,8-cineole synthase [Parasponia andersonii]
MGAMESGYKTQNTIAPLILRNLVSSVFVCADNSFLSLAEKHKLLELIRSILIASVLFFLRLIPYLNPNDYYPFFHSRSPSERGAYTHAPTLADGGGGEGEGSGIGRALSQLLSITSDIPVSSRKYDVVRGLAEKIIEDNRREGSPALREVNRTVISAAFSRTLGQLEAAVVEKGPEVLAESGSGNGAGPVEFRLNRVLRAARSIGEFVLTRVGRVREGANRSGISAEKLAAELIWLAEKMAACGFVGEAVWRWASASRLAWLAVSAQPRLQCSLVKLSAVLFKQSRHVDQKDGLESEKEEQQKQLKIQMLQSWLPLLCRASNGTDSPVLSASERAELERVLEEMIETLDAEQQEKVLTLWLHHFTSCTSSDWPNLHASYARWCDSARETLLLRQE